MKRQFYSPLQVLILVLILLTGIVFLSSCSSGSYSARIEDKSPECVEPGTTVRMDLFFPYPWNVVMDDCDCLDLYPAGPFFDEKEWNKYKKCVEKYERKYERESDKYTLKGDLNVNGIFIEGGISIEDYNWALEVVTGELSFEKKVKGYISFVIPEGIDLDDEDGNLTVIMTFTQEAEKKRWLAKDKSIDFLWIVETKFEIPGNGLKALDKYKEIDHYNTDPYHGNCSGGDEITLFRDALSGSEDFNTDDDGLRVKWDGELLLPDDILTRDMSNITVMSQPRPEKLGEWIQVIVVNFPEYYYTSDMCMEDCDPCWEFLYDQENCTLPPEYSRDWKTDFACKGPCFVEIGNAIGENFNDIVLACQESHMVTIYEKDGSGNASEKMGLETIHKTLPGQPSALAVGFLDDNYFVDAAITLIETDEIIVLLNEGLGFTTSKSYTVGDSPNDVVIADIDGDNINDIVVSNKGSNNITLLKGDGKGGFIGDVWESLDIGEAPLAIIDGNFDNNFYEGRDIAVLLDNNSVLVYTGGTTDEILNLRCDYSFDSEAVTEGIDVESGNYWMDDTDGIAVLCKGGGSNSIMFLEVNFLDEADIRFGSAEIVSIVSVDPTVFRCGAVYQENKYNDFVIGSLNGNIEVLDIDMDDWTILEREELFISRGIKLSDIALGLLKTDDANNEDDLVIATSNYYLISKMNLGDSKGFKE